MSSRTGEIRKALYQLKQQYSFSLGLYYRNSDTVNLETGIMNVTEAVYQIKRALVLPFNLFTKFFQHFASGKFAYGDDLNIERRIFIIDRRDVRGLEIKNSDQWYIIYNHKRYSFEKMENFEYKECYFITGKEMLGTEVMEQYEINVHDWLYLADGFVTSESIVDTLTFSDGAQNS